MPLLVYCRCLHDLPPLGDTTVRTLAPRALGVFIKVIRRGDHRGQVPSGHGLPRPLYPLPASTAPRGHNANRAAKSWSRLVVLLLDQAGRAAFAQWDRQA